MTRSIVINWYFAQIPIEISDPCINHKYFPVIKNDGIFVPEIGQT